MKSKLSREKMLWLQNGCDPSHQDIVSGLRHMATSARKLDKSDLADDIDFIADRYILEVSAGSDDQGWTH